MIESGAPTMLEYSPISPKNPSAEKFWGRSPSRGGQAISGQKGRGLGEGIFARLLPFPVPFEKRKSGRGVWGNSAFPLRNQIEDSPATCLNTWKAGHHRKILFSLKEKEIRRAQNEKSKEYFSVVWRSASWRRAVAGLASLLGVFLKKSSNINQKTPQKIRNSNFRQKYGRHEVPSVLNSPKKS